MKLTIFYTTEKDNNWNAFVWFKCTEASSHDFNEYVKCARMIREASKWKMIYDDTLKANTIESSVPEKTVEHIRKTFDETFRKRFEKLNIVIENKEIQQFNDKDIVDIQEEIDFSWIEENITLIENKYLNEDFKLKKHQKEWLCFTVNKKKAYLAFEPGTWKSLIFFSTILYLHEFHNLNNFILVWPAAYWASRNLNEEFKNYMKEEIKDKINLCLFQWSKPKQFKQFLENKSDINIMIVSYETLRWKSLNEIIEWVKENLWNFQYIWCDEAKALMNSDSKQSQAIREVIKNNSIDYIQLWEWTPIRWFADDLWNVLDMIEPTKWWSYWSFRNRFCVLRDIPIWSNRTIKMVVWTQNWIELHNRLKWLMLTKKLDDLWDVPEVIFSKIVVDITNSKHKKLLKQITDEYTEWYKDYKKSRWESTRWIKNWDEANNKLTQVLRLYQWTTIPSLFDSSIDYEDIEQIQVLKEFVEESILSNNKKVVIFTKFRESAKAITTVLQNLLNERNKKWWSKQKVINYSEFSSSEKIEQVKLFQNDDDNIYPIFVSTIDWGWASITLTKSSVLVFYEKPFTWAEVKQALRRVQRISQKEKVRIISIVAKWTISEKIEKKIMNKKESSDIIMDWSVDVIEEDVNSFEDFVFDLESLKETID